ncbi:Mediator of RNA polymerase II transcription subunit 13 [Mycena chlorophos]|uniref:Mediator of RNA polymerase II transcription subunit 13 n=1 Tax=Mycena chlorophos TaxID=658473 RepID=A0A8H6S007_MYCCL|nr:Mediator of RNA polymerase II transcription subunit 13 [Mycena chlorophos]
MANRPPTASDRLLASAIPLPPDALISCHTFSPVAGPSSQAYSRAYADQLEVARREILARNESRNASLTRSLLPSVHIGSSDSCLYVFAIGKQGQPSAELAELVCDGLAVTSQVSFAPADLYPCSVACSGATVPCPTCMDPDAPRQPLPRLQLRTVYSHFLEAVRTRLIQDLSEASNSKQPHRARQVKRFKGGFVLGPLPSSTEWSKGWDNQAASRPLVFCQLQIHLVTQPHPQLIVHPQMHTTPFVGLPHGPGRPLPEGAPITLLPHGTPAFYLASYSGPTSALRRQFNDSLKGLGVCGWDAAQGDHETTFVIAWINVENKQGEEKGVTVIYPLSLCLGFTPAAPSATAGRREPLSYIPDLPPQLQPSPQLTSAIPQSAVLAPPVPSHLQFSLRPASCPPAPSALAMRSFRTLTVSRSRNLRQIASHVNGFVDSVAKERERERERMRRERERDGGSPHLARTSIAGVAATTPAATPASAPPQTPAAVHASMLPPTPVSQSSVAPSSVSNPAPSTFYPSPPQADQLFGPTDESRTSPVVPDPTPIPAPVVNTQPPLDSYTQSYMDIDMAMTSFGSMNDMIDLDMDFGMGSTTGAARGVQQQRGAVPTTMDFETEFTEDDFSFFDAPAMAAQPVPMAPPPSMPFTHGGSMFNGMLGMSPPNLLFGESPSAALDWNQFTPGPDMQQASISGIPSVPELLPPTPGETPTTHSISISAPVTPSVFLADGDDHSALGGHGPAGLLGTFDAIRFAETHRLADGKYAIGKFSLPSPPPESDDDETVVGLGSAFRLAGGGGGGWADKYASRTDPRVSVFKKLIGVKRKLGLHHGIHGRSKSSPGWQREVEDWEMRTPDAEELANTSEFDESDEEEPEMEEETPLESRPSTPPPAYLPLGPTLLHTHFLHAHLLSVSNPLRPPGSAVAPSSMAPFSAASASVPTPVSPAALLGVASEKSKSLEAVAFAVGREVVENSVWGEAWRATLLGTAATSKPSLDAVWPADVKAVAQLLQLVPDVQGPLDLDALFQLAPIPAAKKVLTLDAPNITIGKAEAVVQLAPSSLRFWDKLGLTPKGGRKNATVFVLFEDDGETRVQLAEAWLAKVSTLYKTRNLGTLTPGKHDACAEDGLLAMRFDSTFRRNMALFVSALSPTSTLVFYICTPLATMSLASPLLRQVFSSVKKALQALDGPHKPLFEFIPEAAIMGLTNQNPALQVLDMESVCLSTYDRILSPVDRISARPLFPDGEPVRAYFQDFAYALARPSHPTAQFMDQVKPPLDVFDAGMFLHVGYGFSECGKWILCAVVDQRGEAHDLAVWLTQTQAPEVDENDPSEGGGGEAQLTNEEYAVRKIWDFAYGFAQKANLAWRIVIAKLGSMSVADLEAWNSFLPKTVQKCSIPNVQVALLSVEPDAPWSFVSPATKSSVAVSTASKTNARATSRTPSGPPASTHQAKTQTLLVDVSSTTYAIFPRRHLPLPVPLLPTVDLGLVYSYVPEASGGSAGAIEDGGSIVGSPASPAIHVTTLQTAAPHPLPIQPLSTTLIVRVPAASIASTPSMLHIALLDALPRSRVSSTGVEELHRDITLSFHELTVLAAARWRLSASAGVDPLLPFHLAAVDAMKGALGRAASEGGGASG